MEYELRIKYKDDMETRQPATAPYDSEALLDIAGFLEENQDRLDDVTTVLLYRIENQKAYYVTQIEADIRSLRWLHAFEAEKLLSRAHTQIAKSKLLYLGENYAEENKPLLSILDEANDGVKNAIERLQSFQQRKAEIENLKNGAGPD